MRVVIDGLSILPGSNQIVIEHLLRAWVDAHPGDELHLLIGPDAGLTVPDGVGTRTIDLGRRRYLGRLRAQATVVPRLCRTVGADVMLGTIPSTTVTRLPCPRAVIAWDLRHELRPDQFSTAARRLRKVSYDIGFRQADAIITISERTRDDLLRSRPWLARRIVRAAQLGSDHADSWPRTVPETPYALTFGQWSNKNVGLVVDAWELLRERGPLRPLSVVGLGTTAREALAADIARRGLDDVVRLQPWLTDQEFRACFASAGLIVFPSDFEGFGLPAAEAMRLGIPLVITPEPALLEVTDGHAVVTADWTTRALADAVVAAGATDDAALAAARERAAHFTWRRTAEATRETLAEAVRRVRPARRSRPT
ncbi:glycosyltransferase [Paraconexibacter antarcticus]|uniref:Glycosyltransferase n=1 Tax=Paraconexibacter antarcticus TaxID=2949664 RepID=A0ABY5DNF0_9ACTN|nr:glycosyltransferase [Paraconexibacter antarcticus]UTI62602.1 glycosyltransferase [Paraconexibacter antarcticus]